MMAAESPVGIAVVPVCGRAGESATRRIRTPSGDCCATGTERIFFVVAVGRAGLGWVPYVPWVL